MNGTEDLQANVRLRVSSRIPGVPQRSGHGLDDADDADDADGVTVGMSEMKT